MTSAGKLVTRWVRPKKLRAHRALDPTDLLFDVTDMFTP
jgi:hypothetical protein